MSYQSYSKKIEYAQMLIQKNQANTLKILSKKLDVSTRTTQRISADIKDKGIQLIYDRKDKKYKII